MTQRRIWLNPLGSRHRQTPKVEFEPPKMRRVAVVMLGSMLWGVSLCAAQGTQEAPLPDPNGPPTLADQAASLAAASVAQTPGQPSWIAERRACEGCPPRSVGRALFQTTVVNVFYGVANLVRGQVTARVTPKTWWDNMEQGWVWDLDDFTVNQVGHPYQGNNYFTTGRANGLSFYESAAVTAFGSATWEYFGETNHASLNDFINTTLGGIALGEMFHRTAWLLRDTRATGRGRLWREIGATVARSDHRGESIHAGGCLARHRQAGRHGALEPDRVSAQLGVLWRGTRGNAFTATGQPFLEVDAIYGDPEKGHSRTPYDAFAVRLRFGGGSAFSEARVRGRLLGQPFKNDKVQFSVVQSYDFQKNDAYATGSQSFEAAFGFTQNLSSKTRMWVLGWGGLTVLGAIDSLPLGLTEVPEEEEESGDAGQGVSEGPRYYDYGPGSDFGVTANFSRNNRPFADALLRGPSPLLPRRRAREPLPAARTHRPPAATARRARPGRHRRVLRSTDVLSGRRPHACQATTIRRCAPTSRGGCREPLDRAPGCAAFACSRSPGPGVRPGSPAGTVEPAGRRRLRRCGSWPAARSRRCAAIVRRARRTSRIATPVRCWAISDIASILAWTSAPKSTGCRSTPRRETSARRTSMRWRSSGPGPRRGSS